MYNRVIYGTTWQWSLYTQAPHSASTPLYHTYPTPDLTLTSTPHLTLLSHSPHLPHNRPHSHIHHHTYLTPDLTLTFTTTPTPHLTSLSHSPHTLTHTLHISPLTYTVLVGLKEVDHVQRYPATFSSLTELVYLKNTGQWTHCI